MTELKEEISKLKSILKEPDRDDFVFQFEDKLENIYSTSDPRMIQELVMLFEDDFEFDELMFSIIHTIETFDDETYVQEVLKTVPRFIESSPRWASIVFLRIINDPNCQLVLLKNIGSIKDKKSFILLIENIGSQGEELKDTVEPILNILKG